LKSEIPTKLRLRLEILKKLNDFDYVLGIMGDYTGSNPSMGPIHDIKRLMTGIRIFHNITTFFHSNDYFRNG